jgi:hypothetical protein
MIGCVTAADDPLAPGRCAIVVDAERHDVNVEVFHGSN